MRPGSTGRVGRPQHFVVGLVHDHVPIALHLEVCGLVRCDQLVFRIQGSPTRNCVASFRNGHATRLQYQLVEQRGEFGDIRDAAAKGGRSHGRAKEHRERHHVGRKLRDVMAQRGGRIRGPLPGT